MTTLTADADTETPVKPTCENAITVHDVTIRCSKDAGHPERWHSGNVEEVSATTMVDVTATWRDA